MTEMTETYPPLPLSAPSSPPVGFPSLQREETRPYIRTSFSSGYIRSNSTYHNPSASSPIAASPSSPSLRRHSQSRGHRYTKSLTSQATPPPLPLPQGQGDSGYTSNREDSDDRAETAICQWRLQRSESTPLHAHGERVERSSTLPNLPVSSLVYVFVYSAYHKPVGQSETMDAFSTSAIPTYSSSFQSDQVKRSNYRSKASGPRDRELCDKVQTQRPNVLALGRQ